jgi:hypothetical protein
MNESEASEKESRGRTDLEVTVLPNGVVNVNRPNGSGRAHSVFLGAHGDVTRCSCRGHRFHGHCAHADAVAARPLVTASAQAAAASTPRVATDGGVENPTGGDESAENGGESAPDGDDSSDERDRPTRSEPADFGGGTSSGMDDLGDPAETVENADDAGTDAAAGLGTVTGWGGGVEPDTEDETVDETKL